MKTPVEVLNGQLEMTGALFAAFDTILQSASLPANERQSFTRLRNLSLKMRDELIDLKDGETPSLFRKRIEISTDVAQIVGCFVPRGGMAFEAGNFLSGEFPLKDRILKHLSGVPEDSISEGPAKLPQGIIQVIPGESRGSRAVLIIFTVMALLMIVGCSRDVVVVDAGAGGSSSSSSSASSSSSSSASSTSTGTLSCIGAIGECEKDATPTPGIACKTNIALTSLDGVCDAGGNCCKGVP